MKEIDLIHIPDYPKNISHKDFTVDQNYRKSFDVAKAVIEVELQLLNIIKVMNDYFKLVETL